MSVAIVADRNCDVRELLKRATHLESFPKAEAILKRWLRASDQVWLGMHDGEVACVWGLAPPSTISDRAYLWLLTTDLVDKHKFIFVRHSQIVIEEALKSFPMIMGHVEIGNDRARKWLRWLGAEFGSTEGRMTRFVIRRK